MSKIDDLISRHADITARISETNKTIAEIQASLAVPAVGGDVDKTLKAAAKERAQLAEFKAQLEHLGKMKSHVIGNAASHAEELEKQEDQAYRKWQLEARAALTELLKSDEATKLREFLAAANWLYKAGGGNRFKPLKDDSQMKEFFDTSDEVCEAFAKKSDVFIERPEGNSDLISDLRDISEGHMRSLPVAKPSGPRPMSNTHVRASQEERARVSSLVKSSKGTPTYAGPPVGGAA